MYSRTSLLSLVQLLLRALILPSAHAASRSYYISKALNAADVLNQNWYNISNGQWQDLWWNSANMITTFGDLTPLCSKDILPVATYFFENTLFAAPASNGGSFLKDFYDDKGWWAMAWLRVYDITLNTTYLDAAKDIFTDMAKGANATCGGHWWSKDNDANTAIGNELYVSVAAALANRVDDQKSYYRDTALQEVEWFLNSGLINENNTINDGLDLTTCEPTGTVFTYNQGVILGALVELYKLTSNQTYLDTASRIAHGAIEHLTDDDGILTEPGYPGPLDLTSGQFKGVFARNLAYLQSFAGDDAYVSFLQTNADALWARCQESGKLGPNWQGPYSDATAPSQSSALDCLVAAAALSP